MAQQEDIEEQKKLLETHRRTLSINLMQFALFGIKFVPPHVLHGIREARQQITSIKQILREWGVDVADYPDDEDGDNTIKDMLEGVANQSYVEPDSHRLFLRSEHSEIRSGAYNYIRNYEPAKINASRLIVFDTTHGQPNWQLLGKTKIEKNNLSELASLLKRHGFHCSFDISNKKVMRSRGIVISPPTGRFNRTTSEWESNKKTMFTYTDVQNYLEYISSGGCLIAFGYRFGDMFAKSNLNTLLTQLGCFLNSDTVVDSDPTKVSPLEASFETITEDIVQDWARVNVKTVLWRPMSTIEINDVRRVSPVVMSPSQCVRINYSDLKTLPGSKPICVSGTLGKGRYIVVGGPHAFESSTHGFFSHNSHFVDNIINWLFGNPKQT